jgi:hypothetical protein
MCISLFEYFTVAADIDTLHEPPFGDLLFADGLRSSRYPAITSTVMTTHAALMETESFDEAP